jgi:basic membrane protein A and related proteins
MFKKITLVMMLIFALGLFTACGAEATPAPAEPETPAEVEEAAEPTAEPMEEEAAAGDCSSPDVFCIGLVTDVGQIDDKSFNQSAWEGVLAAERELGAQVDFLETRDAKDYAENIGLFVDRGYDVIVTVGFALGEATAEAAKANPEVAFIGVDQFQGEEIPNLTGLIFNEDKAGYLAGALAAMMSESGTIAAVLGTDLVPPVVAFKVGFENGAKATNPDINLISTFHPGGLDVAFTDPEWGAATAKQAIDQGADVVFGAGGNTGNGALIEVAGNEGVYCIGVDSDQWETLPAAHPCLISSAMKLITPGVLEIATAIQAGNQPAGNFFGDVGLAPFHDFADVIPAEVQQTLIDLDAALRDGSVSTGY